VRERARVGTSVRVWMRLDESPLTPNGACVKTFNTTKVRVKEHKAYKTDAEQDGTAESGNYDVLKRSSMKVHHYEVINGKRYKVLTVG